MICEDSGSPLNTNQKKGQNITVLEVSGMNCQNCVRHVKEAAMSVNGVAFVDVDLSSRRAIVKWESQTVRNPQSVMNAIKRAGYGAKEINVKTVDDTEKDEQRVGWWEINIIIGILAFIPLFVGEWFLDFGEEKWFNWVAFFLALPVQIICGKQFYIGAWQQLKRGNSNMDTLVALGSTAAFGYSVIGLFMGATHLYFMEAIGIITLISIGHFLEYRMSQRAGAALKSLMNLAPSTAHLLENGEREVEVPISELKPGNLVIIKPGDHCPTDGVIVKGSALFNESMLTGESLPAHKAVGSAVFAGTVNQDGVVVMRVEAVGEETALSRIVDAVRRAQESKADIQRLADRVSNVFVPIVILIAVGSAIWWGFGYASASNFHQFLAGYLWSVHIPDSAVAATFINMAAVLIIACPCAMGLATPVALMAGTSVAARRGILIRDGKALEKTGKITSVIFDKTGTLTEGELTVSRCVDIKTGSTLTSDVREIAKMIARPSNHPICKAVYSASEKQQGIQNNEKDPIIDWKELRGLGVEMKIDNNGTSNVFRLGSIKWLESCGVDLSDYLKSSIKDSNFTLVGLSKDNSLLAVFELEDKLKSGAREVIEKLKGNGLRIYLITGDRKKTALRVAEQCGIETENVYSEIVPERKAEIVASLQKKGERVAFVGDGINDAPALKTADLGIAVEKATDIAREAADIVLLRSDIYAIPEALALSQATLRTIKQNLFWAFFYNAAAVPLAALGFLSPIVCAAAMGVSDIVVIGNALRLNRWKYNRS